MLSRYSLVALFFSFVMTVCIFAEPIAAERKTFDFKDPKGVNAITLLLDAPLEPISGIATGVSGTLDFDPDQPTALAGHFVVQASTVHMSNKMMTQHLQSDKWLDVAKFPTIDFKITSGTGIKKTGDGVYEGEIQGEFTLHGVTKPVTVPAKATYLPGKLGKRVPNMNGDLLVVRTRFPINRTDFGVNPGAPLETVASEIELTVHITGMAAD